MKHYLSGYRDDVKEFMKAGCGICHSKIILKIVRNGLLITTHFDATVLSIEASADFIETFKTSTRKITADTTY